MELETRGWVENAAQVETPLEPAKVKLAGPLASNNPHFGAAGTYLLSVEVQGVIVHAIVPAELKA